MTVLDASQQFESLYSRKVKINIAKEDFLGEDLFYLV